MVHCKHSPIGQINPRLAKVSALCKTFVQSLKPLLWMTKVVLFLYWISLTNGLLNDIVTLTCWHFKDEKQMLPNAKREVLLLRHCYLSQVANDFSIRATLLSNTTGSSEGETEVCLHQHPFLSLDRNSIIKGCAKPGKKRMSWSNQCKCTGLWTPRCTSDFTIYKITCKHETL